MNLQLEYLLPEGVAAGILILLMISEMLTRGASAPAWRGARIGAVLLFLSVLPYAGKIGSALGGAFILDPFASFFKAVFALIAVVVIAASRDFFNTEAAQKNGAKPGEFLMIFWTSLLGLFFLVSANDLLTAFISLEILTLSLYVLAAYLKHDLRSIEAGLKYLIIGSLASAFFIYGVSLIYAAAGSTSFPDVQYAFAADPGNKLLIAGVLLIISAIGFKIAAVPFQLWAPDVYQGAPLPVVAYLSTASKAAGFALLLRLLHEAFAPFEEHRRLLFPVLAAMTMIYGNFGALRQTSVKRLFGYSSIGHAGYLLTGIAAGGENGAAAVLYYLPAYALTNLTAFLAMTAASKGMPDDSLDSFRGLGRRAPLLAGTFFLALLSLAGVPPLAGFFGKFLVLLAAVQNGPVWLALLGALIVAVSLYYYLTVVRVMYFEKGESAPIETTLSTRILLIVLSAGILILGIWQAPFYGFARQAASSLF